MLIYSRNSPSSPISLPSSINSSNSNSTAANLNTAHANRANSIRSLADQLSPLHISVSNNNSQYTQPSPETSKSGNIAL